MSSHISNISYYDSTGASDYSFSKPYGEKTAELIDKEVKDIINEQYERAKRILTENAQGHNELANLLIEREVIFSDDLEKIFGKRPWASRSEELLNETPAEIKKEEKTAEKIEEEINESEKEKTASSNKKEKQPKAEKDAGKE
jgi:cell division protease FtsH